MIVRNPVLQLWPPSVINFILFQPVPCRGSRAGGKRFLIAKHKIDSYRRYLNRKRYNRITNSRFLWLQKKWHQPIWFHARRDNRDCEAAPFPSILYLLHSGRAISRVLYWTIIYLDLPLLTSSSDLPTGRWRAATLGPYLVLLRMGFTRPVCLHTAGELLPHHFNLTTAVLFRRNVSVALSL